jgi:uncharacterized membrane protein
MNDQRPKPKGEGTDLGESSGELSPLNIIRTETVISRLPIHNLSKKGRVNIQIVRKTSKGEVELKWEVSYSDRYGQPRQLAYKLDTLVINRRIDEEGRPLPKLIQIGSLREIADDLGLGGDTASVKKALRQNASAFITAKLNYTGNDGSERHLEADFTRYSVIFTGEKLPDGRKADVVYIILNEPYREVVNNSPVRPLDYDYLKILPPVAQRFYEIVSRKIFAALKHGHEHARLSYGEFCTYSAQQRQPDYDHFKKQMYKVHRPHLKSGYISKIEYDAMTDADGNQDWMMLYTPGAKAHAEFEVFNGPGRMKRQPRRRVNTTKWKERILPPPTEDYRAGDDPLPPQLETSKHSPPVGASVLDKSPEPTSVVDEGLLHALTTRDVMGAHALLVSLPTDQLERTPDYIEYWDAQKSTGKNVGPGFLYELIRKGDPLPSSFETSRQRAVREAEQKKRSLIVQAKQAIEFAYDDYKSDTIDRYIADRVSADDFARRVELASKAAAKQQSFWERAVRPETRHHMAEHQVRAEIVKDVPLLSFEEFHRREASRILTSYGIDPAELGITSPETAGAEQLDAPPESSPEAPQGSTTNENPAFKEESVSEPTPS